MLDAEYESPEAPIGQELVFPEAGGMSPPPMGFPFSSGELPPPPPPGVREFVGGPAPQFVAVDLKGKIWVPNQVYRLGDIVDLD